MSASYEELWRRLHKARRLLSLIDQCDYEETFTESKHNNWLDRKHEELRDLLNLRKRVRRGFPYPREKK